MTEYDRYQIVTRSRPASERGKVTHELITAPISDAALRVWQAVDLADSPLYLVDLARYLNREVRDIDKAVAELVAAGMMDAPAG